MKKDVGPGVPEAVPRTVQRLVRALGADEIDRLWIFPPLKKGRKEWGLIAASCFSDGGMRRLITATYAAEQTGAELTIVSDMTEEGLAPPDRLPRVMSGVVRRSEMNLGDPRPVEIGGDVSAYDSLIAEFDPALLEREAEPAAESARSAEVVES